MPMCCQYKHKKQFYVALLSPSPSDKSIDLEGEVRGQMWHIILTLYLLFILLYLLYDDNTHHTCKNQL